MVVFAYMVKQKEIVMIGIVFINTLDVCPYIEKYMAVLEKLNMPYEIIYWDRKNLNQNYPENHHVLRHLSKEEKSPLFKLRDFSKFKRFAVNKILEKKYEKLIILSTMTGMILYPFLKKHYSKKFLFDYRDASYEYLSFFRKRLHRLVAFSSLTCISSKGFLEVLPSDVSYVLAHNFRYEDINSRIQVSNLNKSEVIKLCIIGLLREKDFLKRQIDLFGDDPRFQLYIHGGGEWLEYTLSYADPFDNIFVTGRYDNSDKGDLIKDKDLIMFNYISNFNNNKLMANRFYDALIYKKPMVGNIEILSGQVIEENELGISLSYDDPLYKDKIIEYYKYLEGHEFNRYAEAYLDKVLLDDEIYLNRVSSFLSEV